MPESRVLIIEDNNESTKKLVASLDSLSTTNKKYKYVADTVSDLETGCLFVQEKERNYDYAFVDLNIYQRPPIQQDEYTPTPTVSGGWLIIALLRHYHPDCKIIITTSQSGVSIHTRGVMIYDVFNIMTDRNMLDFESCIRSAMTKKHVYLVEGDLEEAKKTNEVLDKTEYKKIKNGKDSNKISTFDMVALETQYLLNRSSREFRDNFKIQKILKTVQGQWLSNRYLKERIQQVSQKLRVNPLIPDEVKIKLFKLANLYGGIDTTKRQNVTPEDFDAMCAHNNPATLIDAILGAKLFNCSDNLPPYFEALVLAGIKGLLTGKVNEEKDRAFRGFMSATDLSFNNKPYGLSSGKKKLNPFIAAIPRAGLPVTVTFDELCLKLAQKYKVDYSSLLSEIDERLFL